MWHEWIYKEIGQARLMLNDLESCQHLVEVEKFPIKSNIPWTSCKTVYGSWGRVFMRPV
jgi:hypothetical protein